MAKLIKRSKEGILAMLSISEWEFVSNMEKIRTTRRSNKAIAIEFMAERYPKSVDMHELLAGMREKGAIFASKAPLKALGVMMTQYDNTFMRTEGAKGCKSKWTVEAHLRTGKKKAEKPATSKQEQAVVKDFGEMKLAMVGVMQDGAMVMTVGEITKGVFVENDKLFGMQKVAPPDQVRAILKEGNGKDFFKLKDDGKEKWRLSSMLRGGE